jgi:hypothetical protein
MSRGGWDEERTPEVDERPSVGRASGGIEDAVADDPREPDRGLGRASMLRDRMRDERPVVWRDRPVPLTSPHPEKAALPLRRS